MDKRPDRTPIRQPSFNKYWVLLFIYMNLYSIIIYFNILVKIEHLQLP